MTDTLVTTPDRPDDWDHLWERRLKALSLHNGGMTYRQIAAALDVSAETVRKDIRQARIEIVGESAEDMLARQRSILHDVVRKNYAQMLRGNKDATGHILKALDQEAKLFGLNAPARIAVGITKTEFAEKLADLLDVLDDDDTKEIKSHGRNAEQDRRDARAEDQPLDVEAVDLPDTDQTEERRKPPPGWSNL